MYASKTYYVTEKSGYGGGEHVLKQQGGFPILNGDDFNGVSRLVPFLFLLQYPLKLLCFGATWNKPVEGGFLVLESKIVGPLRGVIIDFEIRVHHLLKEAVTHKIDVPCGNFHRRLLKENPPARQQGDSKLVHGLFILRMAGSGKRLHGVLVPRVAGSEPLIGSRLPVLLLYAGGESMSSREFFHFRRIRDIRL